MHKKTNDNNVKLNLGSKLNPNIKFLKDRKLATYILKDLFMNVY